MKNLKLLLTVATSLLILSTTSCSKDETPSCSNGKQDGAETGIDCGGECTVCTDNVSQTYYFSGLVDGDQFTLQSSEILSSGGKGELNGECDISVGSRVEKYNDNQTKPDRLNIMFRFLYTGDCASTNDTSVYNHLYPLGKYGFNVNEGPNNSWLELEFTYNNVEYSVYNYGTQPASSYFSIIEATPVEPWLTRVGVKLKLRFSCLVKSEAGEVLEIRNAEVVLPFHSPDL